jgi:hypothetical protein
LEFENRRGAWGVKDPKRRALNRHYPGRDRIVNETVAARNPTTKNRAARSTSRGEKARKGFFMTE